jgi:hypothetical protein
VRAVAAHRPLSAAGEKPNARSMRALGLIVLNCLMADFYPIKGDSVTDDQLAAMRQAAGRLGEEAWVGDMAAALECCDRGWLSVAHLSNGLDDRESVFYLITVRGAAVLRRQQGRRPVH